MLAWRDLSVTHSFRQHINILCICSPQNWNFPICYWVNMQNLMLRYIFLSLDIAMILWVSSTSNGFYCCDSVRIILTFNYQFWFLLLRLRRTKSVIFRYQWMCLLFFHMDVLRSTGISTSIRWPCSVPYTVVPKKTKMELYIDHSSSGHLPECSIVPSFHVPFNSSSLYDGQIPVWISVHTCVACIVNISATPAPDVWRLIWNWSI